MCLNKVISLSLYKTSSTTRIVLYKTSSATRIVYIKLALQHL